MQNNNKFAIKNILQIVQFYAYLVWDITITIGLCFITMFISVCSIFKPTYRKCITGQIVLITGAGNGIGKSIALRLAKEKCRIAVADIDINAAQQTVAELSSLNVVAKAYQVDVANPNEIDELRQSIERDLGSVDILINNAGIAYLCDISDGSNEEIDRMVKVNVNSNYYCVRTFLPAMKERKSGHIISIASVCSFHPAARTAVYASTKFAVHGFIEALYHELRRDGYHKSIYTTSIHPYFVPTKQVSTENINVRIPPNTLENVSEATVQGILKNSRMVVIPREGILLFYIRCLSFLNQDTFRDIVLKEHLHRLDNCWKKLKN